MNDKQLGVDPSIQQLDGKPYIEITRDGQIERLILTELLKKQAMIAGRVTTCWRAYRAGDELKTSLIVKDSWQYEERPEEGELVKEERAKVCETSHGTIITRRCRLMGRMTIPPKMCERG